MQPNQVNYSQATPILDLLPVFPATITRGNQQDQPLGRLNGMDIRFLETGRLLLQTNQPDQQPWKDDYLHYFHKTIELLSPINVGLSQNALQADYQQQEIADPVSYQHVTSSSVKRGGVAEKNKPYECNWCHRKAVSLAGIKKHFRRNHPELPQDQRSFTCHTATNDRGAKLPVD